VKDIIQTCAFAKVAQVAKATKATKATKAAHTAIMVVALCCALLGIQSTGLIHGVLHANAEQRLQSMHVFDGIENSVSPDADKSNLVCKLLDSLLLGASAVSGQIQSPLCSASHIAPLAVIQTSLALSKFWFYQSQAPPQSTSQ
jgi:hypothetical protein